MKEYIDHIKKTEAQKEKLKEQEYQNIRKKYEKTYQDNEKLRLDNKELEKRYNKLCVDYDDEREYFYTKLMKMNYQKKKEEER